MKDAQRKVREFHLAFGQTVGDAPAIRDAELRKRLVNDEAKEFCDAVDAGDLVGAVQEAVDLIYVAAGSLVAFGVDGAAVLDAIHAANMAKFGPDGKPILDAGGKVVKPPGWSPPDVEAAIYACQIGSRDRCENRATFRVDHGYRLTGIEGGLYCEKHTEWLRSLYDKPPPGLTYHFIAKPLGRKAR